jgi:Ni,Fe-hydrogenase I cytochrome b subunit
MPARNGTRAAASHSSISRQVAASSRTPVTWWKGILARIKTLAISGTGHAEQKASHSPVIAVRSFKLVEGFVIDGGFRLQVQHDHRHTGALHKRQNGVRKRIGGDVEKQHVDVFAAALMAGFKERAGVSTRPRLTNSTPGRVSRAATCAT